MPWKTWSVGEEVLAADFNDYIQEQVVATFTNSAARDTAIGTPLTGQCCFLTATKEFQIYNGTAWSTILAPWQTWTPPTVLFGGTAVTLTASDGGYRRLGNGWQLMGAFKINSVTASGDTVLRVVLPAGTGSWVPAGGLTGALQTVGTGTMMSVGGGVAPYFVSIENYNNFIFRPCGFPLAAGDEAIKASHIAVGHEFSFSAIFRGTGLPD